MLFYILTKKHTQSFLFVLFFTLFFCFINLLLCILFIIDDEFIEKQHHRASKKAQRKDFVRRMHARNGKCLFLFIFICIDFISFDWLITDCMLRYITSLIFFPSSKFICDDYIFYALNKWLHWTFLFWSALYFQWVEMLILLICYLNVDHLILLAIY